MTLWERRTNVGRCSATALGIDIPAILLDRANDVIEKGIDLVWCMSPFLARLRHPTMSAQWSLSGEKRTSRRQPISVAIDPEGTWSERAFVIQMEWRLHLISLVSNVDLLFSQTAP